MLRYKDQLGRASPLASALPSFRSRDGQLRLAQQVGDTIDRGGVLVAEWPERADGALAEDHVMVRFEVTGEDRRALQFEGHGARAIGVVARMRGG